MNLRKISFILVIYFSTTTAAKANILTNLKNYAENNGNLMSLENPKVIESQRSGFVTGGSLINRGPRPESLRPLTVQPPSFEFDPCTGSFDARFGSFSYISGKQFAKFFKNTASSSGAYVLKMSIKEVCPSCEDIMTYLETVARDINNMSLNQCSLAKSIAQGGMAAMNSARQQKCMMQSAVGGEKKDMFKTATSCIDDPARHGNKGDDKELDSLLGDNFNLVWKGLNPDGLGGADKELCEMMMSISGSIIGQTKDGSDLTLSLLPSLLEEEDMLEKYIGTPDGVAAIVPSYKCDNSKNCLNPVKTEQSIGKDGNFYGKVADLLATILKKVQDKPNMDVQTEFTVDEKALIEFSSVPLISLIEMELATKGGDGASLMVGMAEFVEVVCYDIVSNYMQKMLNKAKSAVEILQTAQLDNTAIDRFTQNVERVRGLLRDKRFMAFKKLQVIMQVKNRIIQQQNVFELGFTRYISTQSQE